MKPGVAALVARTEVRRTLRIVAGDRTKLLLMGLVALFALGPITLLGVLAMPQAGEAVAAGAVSDLGGFSIANAAAGAAAVAWLGATVVATVRSVTSSSSVDEPACLLLSTTTGTAVFGLVGAEVLLFSIWLGPPVALLAGAFAYGAGSVVPVAAALLVLALILLTALPVGFLVGSWIRHLLTSYEPVARYRTILFVLVGVGYFGAITTGWFDRLLVVAFETLGGTPAGWPGAWLLLAVPGVSPSAVALVGSVLGAAVAIPVVLAAGVASARVHWFADPARSEATAGEVRSSDRLEGLLAGAVDRATRTVAVTTIRRTRRAPVQLLYVAYPLFGAIYFVEEIIRMGRLPTTFAVLLCAYVVWGAGALFSLNVLGDYGRALPGVLTTPVSGRQAVGGTILASVLVAAPVGLVVATLVGLVSPLSIRSTALLVTATVVGVVASPALGAGIGTVFPRFGSVRITSNREAVMPGKAAFLTYTIALALPGAAAAILSTDGGAALVADVATALGQLAPGPAYAVSAGAVTVGAWAVLGLGLLAPIVSVLYAIETFDRFDVDRDG
ncbi:hypothetical protein [Halovivax limisalsi]|uniref:hypothetical protein n=1 Tax=Halovivax limisalsi TaxID=1453760 RepID=UPI001FFC56C8|nr:hypothetical protein [Halovivax limisalsi]